MIMEIQGIKIDPKLDLVLEREVDVKPELVWEAWTQPKHIIHWFTPVPWKTIEARIESIYGAGYRFVKSDEKMNAQVNSRTQAGG
jgi:uncharacterized protein YndB with AHSA1/START domain